MSSRKILIVEDDPDLMKVYSRALKKHGILLQVEDTDTAWEKLLANPDIAIVILDGSPTGHMIGSTAQLAKMIRSQAPNCRLMAIVGNVHMSDELVSVCDAALEKPMSPPELLAFLGLS